ncbi:uncharacterized protein [Amphiura filiformis]|uniref:uncharacterized protein n=1 Tax=Amphiura filiformis TaxID=82378 RepID=UPI003B21B2C2
METPVRVEGWLKVFDEGALEICRHGRRPVVKFVSWKVKFCILVFKPEAKLHHLQDEKAAWRVRNAAPGPAVRINKAYWNFFSRLNSLTNLTRDEPIRASWGAYRPRKPRRFASMKSNVDINQDHGLGRTRRKSAPGGPVQMTLDGGQPTNNNKITGIFPRRMKVALKRTKSVGGKFERQISNKSADKEFEFEPADNMSSSVKGPRDSLFLGPHASLDVFDLTDTDMVIRPLHASILGQDHCFQITTSMGTKYYSCRSADERDKWIESILSAIHPEKDERRRTDNLLKLWVVEAKNLASKKNVSQNIAIFRYYCDICIDETLHARTTTKLTSEQVFWGEQFQFPCLPDVETVNVHLYKEVEKKRKKDKNYLGVVAIPLDDIESRSNIEKWYPITNHPNRGDIPSLRIKARYQSVNILPISQYSEFAQYLKDNAAPLCRMLEKEINVKTKEEVAVSLVRILQCLGTAKEFLSDIVITETNSVSDESLIFRANTMATKSMEAYMKLIGGKYLQDTLGDFIQTLYEGEDDCEVDPTKVQPGSLQQHQSTLTMLCEMACCKIINSSAQFPSDLKAVFHSLRDQSTDRQNGVEICDKLISGCIFLRFLCPAIMSPSLFDLIQEYPTEKTARCLTLIAKTVQALANFSKFGVKENYMIFMNTFVEREWGNMKTFLNEISADQDHGNTVKFDGYIDLGKELSVLHGLLVEALEDSDKIAEEKIGPLKNILKRITDIQAQPEDSIPYQPGGLALQQSTITTTTSSMTTVIETESMMQQTQVKKSLDKIFEDAELSNTRDVEMLPPYNIAMERSITSSTVNDLVDLIHPESPSPSEASTIKMDSIERTRQMETSTERTLHIDERDIADYNGGSLRINRTAGKLNTYSSLQRNVGRHTVTTTTAMIKPKSAENLVSMGGEGQTSVTRVLPLSFSNPAYQLSKRKLHRNDGSNSASSVSSSSPSNADSDALSFNHDGDISHNTSSSGGVSPMSDRRMSPVTPDVMSHTLPKASSRTQHHAAIEDIFPNVDKSQTESQSSGAIHTHLKRPTLGAIYTGPPDQQHRTSEKVQSPTEALRTINNNKRAAFFSAAPNESTSNPAISSPRSPTAKQLSQANIHIANGTKQLPSFAFTIPHPHGTVLSPSSNKANYSASISLPTTSSPGTYDNLPQKKSVSESAICMTTASMQLAENTRFMQTAASPGSTRHQISQETLLMSPTSPVTPTPRMGTSSLENVSVTSWMPTRQSSVSTATSSNPTSPTGLTRTASHSPNPSTRHGRRQIRTQYSSKPTRHSSLSESTDTSSGQLSNQGGVITPPPPPVRSSRVQTSQYNHSHNHSVQEQTTQAPIWTRRARDPSAIDQTTQTKKDAEGAKTVKYEVEIGNLKKELDALTAQLLETQKKLDEEEHRADQAIHAMEKKVQESELALQASQEDKDKQIKDIITRLVGVEEELKREREEMQAVVGAKQKIIDAQERRIEALDAANARLMNALDQLKERYQLTRRSKSSSDVRAGSQKLTPYNGNLKSSNC